MAITLVTELFAIDSKVYSTSHLPFFMARFLAKSAICWFKIYSMTYSSCAYCHSGGCGLKAWNRKEKVITSSFFFYFLLSMSFLLSSSSLIFIPISTYNMNHSGTVRATKQSQNVLSALASCDDSNMRQYLNFFPSLSLSGHCCKQNKSSSSLRSFHALSEHDVIYVKCVVELSAIWRFM